MSFKIKLLAEYMGDTVITEDILDNTPEEQAIEAKLDKWDYITLRCSWTLKKTLSKGKRQRKKMEKNICKLHIW